ncbi:MAG: monovalent cation/H+ antiporter subunit D family protein [Candidatus Limnocylindria bacterium]
MFEADLPALLVVTPLLAAPVAVMLQRGTPAWAVAWLASLGSLAFSAALLAEVWSSGPVRYFIGSWPPPWGIEYRVDLANAPLLLLISAVGSVVLPYAKASVEQEIGADRRHLFYAVFLLCLAGLLGTTVTGDAFNVFVFLEIASLATYALVAMGRDRRALTAAYQYLIVGTVGATFILIGIGLMYVTTGTLNMLDLADRLPGAEAPRTVSAALAFFTVGVALKLALFPLHLWLPNSYAYAPSAVTAFIAATSTKVAAYLLMRSWLTVFGHAYTYGILSAHVVVGALAVAGMVGASMSAIFQTNVKRLLAYSSVAQMGYILLGVSIGSQTGIAAGMLHVFNHALIKGALFLAIGCVSYRVGSALLTDMRGIGRQMPWTMAAFVIGGLSLIGLPLTTGFVSKLQLVLGALEQDLWPLALVILATSLLALVYVWKVVEVAYFQPPVEGRRVSEAPLGLLVPTWLLALANVYFGIDTRLTWGLAVEAARALLAGAGG